MVRSRSVLCMRMCTCQTKERGMRISCDVTRRTSILAVYKIKPSEKSKSVYCIDGYKSMIHTACFEFEHVIHEKITKILTPNCHRNRLPSHHYVLINH